MEAHIMPKLAHTSLISIHQLCDHWCTVIYDKEACRVYYKNNLVWRATREPNIGLWVLPLQPWNPGTKNNHYDCKSQVGYANSAYTMTSKANLIKFLHQCASLGQSPHGLRQLITANFPCDLVSLLQPSDVTYQNHQQQIRAIWNKSTKTFDLQNQKTAEKGERYHQWYLGSRWHESNKGRIPRLYEKINFFYFEAISNAITNTIYFDNIVCFLFQSLDRAINLILLYDYESYAILVKPLKTMEHTEFVKAFREQVAYFKHKGLKSKFNVIDNTVSNAVQNVLEEEDINVQIVDPHNHCVNAAERAIQTCKDHFIVGLCTTDKWFQIQQWDHLIEQGQDTLNMLKISRVHLHLSAYTTLKGIHDFNRTPLAPPGTRAMVYKLAKTRGTWALGTTRIRCMVCGPTKTTLPVLPFLPSRHCRISNLCQSKILSHALQHTKQITNGSSNQSHKGVNKCNQWCSTKNNSTLTLPWIGTCRTQQHHQ